MMTFGTFMFLIFNVVVTSQVYQQHRLVIDFVTSHGYNFHFVGQVVHICMAMSWLALLYMMIFFEDAPYRIPGLIPIDCEDLDRDGEKKDMMDPAPLPTKTRRGRSKSARRRRRTQSMDN